MKNVIKLKNLMLIALFTALSVSCDDDNNNDNMVVDNTITGKAVASPNLSILVQALVRAELATTLKGAGPFTVFAPTNEAFTAFLATTPYATINDVPKEALTQILLNHVVTGSVKSTDLTTGYIKTLAKGSASTTNNLSMYVNITAGVKLNGVATVTTPDIMASNGVIHIVDKVIDLPTIVTHAAANANFSTLVSVLNRSGEPNFITALSGTGPFTVFAPTNTAFTALNTELAPDGIAGVSAANLTKVLQYHVVSPANVLAASLTEGQVVTPILVPAQTFTIQLSGGAKIKDARNRFSNIIITDVQCSNGVIHAVDKVLLPLL
ncbi:putative surface protein with fasciclin (FAS1) repeats [Flavobacterium sp. CG_9.1]|uniref:Uncaracterized surface protein containing fasciclin (FAS1) repeats n=1 Tax=Flavobacterium xanthum TaxID=69322 RepID=A0A1M7HY70_9FLAO|nr:MULTISPECIES: fasciclin domain-containing protein [Flavobacterium]MBG6061176.1 putative surface protein with fasciclin (FAS1) repeats [Flavobacterium sp. CG_9.1]SHM33466.1 Uncaracterized surface protein containing fasciclin (FAS1) repeats [Flavobacterium xanthum]